MVVGKGEGKREREKREEIKNKINIFRRGWGRRGEDRSFFSGPEKKSRFGNHRHRCLCLKKG